MKPNQKKHATRTLIYAAVCLALAMVLPLLTGQIPEVGSMLSPMHIPVLLCGFLCGPWYALVVGFAAPLVRFLIFGMPPIYPTGVSMCFELAVYGLVSGLLYRALPKKAVNIYVSLAAAMLAGRVMWGIVRAVISGAGGAPFTWALFFAGAFVQAVPGIILHIVLVPLIVMAMRSAKLMD